MRLELIFFVVFFQLSFFKLAHQREMILEKIEPIPEPNSFVFDSLRVKKFNRSSYVLDGVVTVKMDLDDSMDVTATAYNLAGGQYKKIADKKLHKFCESLWVDSLKDAYNDIRLATNFPEFGTCPWKAEKYWVKNLLFGNDKVLPPYLPGGEQWKFEIRFFVGEDLVAGYDAYFKITKDIPIG